MTNDDNLMTIRELFEENGYDPTELTHPRNVTADDITDDSVVVAYTVVHNPIPNGLATTYDVGEWDIKAVIPTDEVKDWSDGDVSYPDVTPVTHSVHWADSNRGPKLVSIGYGDEMYGPDSDFEDPNRWDRPAMQVHRRSDDFVRFDL